MEEKFEFIDDFLARCEDWMHKEDGNDVTVARKYLNEIRQQIKNCSKNFEENTTYNGIL